MGYLDLAQGDVGYQISDGHVKYDVPFGGL